MNDSRILMIHEVDEWIKDFIFLPNDILTFDDGLYSQFKYFKFYPSSNLKYFFISTNIINNTEIFNQNIVSAPIAHDLYFKQNDLSNYMSIDQILWLDNQNNTFIGGHGHDHLLLTSKMKLIKKFNLIKDDIYNMINVFDDKLKIKLNSFCFPYNNEDEFYKIYLKEKINDIQLFGKNRIDINLLI